MVLNDTLWSTVASKNNRRAATTLKENRLVTAVSKNDNQLSSRNLLGLGSNGHGKAEPEKEVILDNDSMLHDTCWFTVVSKKNRRAATTPEGNGPVTAVPKNDNQLRNQNLLGLGSNGFGKVGSKMDAILDNYLAKPVSDVSLKEAAEKLKQLLPPNWSKSPMAYKLSYKLFDHSLNSSYREKTHEKLAELLVHFERLTGRLTRVSKEGEIHRFEAFGASMDKVYSEPSLDSPNKYVNYNSFVARLFRRGIFKDPTYAIWALAQGLENDISDQPVALQSEYIIGAAMWILWSGQTMFDMLCSGLHHMPPRENPDAWTSGPLAQCAPTFNFDRWQFWQKSFEEISRLRHENGLSKSEDLTSECKAVAGRASFLMQAFETSMRF